MKAKQGEHTPGPWNISTGKEYKIQGKGEQIVFLIGDDRRLIPNPDDARIIAAAPELLAALDELLATHELREYKGERITQMERTAMELAKAAIAKARGPHE